MGGGGHTHTSAAGKQPASSRQAPTCNACGTPLTAAAKAAGSAAARNSSAWPVEAKEEVKAGPREVEPGVDLKGGVL